MVTAKDVQGLADRLARAKALADSGAVFPVAGCDGYAVVRNGDGSQMYLVRVSAGHENCTCPDYQQRQKPAGLPCKHLLAADLALGERPQPEPPDPVIAAGVELLLAPQKRAA